MRGWATPSQTRQKTSSDGYPASFPSGTRSRHGPASRRTSHHHDGSHSTRWEFSGTIPSWTANRFLAQCRECLATSTHRLGRHKRECNDARFGALVDPVMDRSALHEHIAGLEVDGRPVEVHVDLARHDDSIVD